MDELRDAPGRRGTKDARARQRSWPVRVVLRYANAKPTVRSWRKLVLGPFLRDILPKGTEPPETETFGVESFEEAERILDQYRAFLIRLISQSNIDGLGSIDLARELATKAKLEVRGFGWDQRTKRLVVRWDTTGQRFTELLYAYLALALQEHRYDALFQCPACGKFAWQDTERKQKYCSQPCRNRALVEQYRERHPEKYREYHRKLMRRRRRERDDSA